jgi:AmiR/NasT family two-component response regulator
VPTTRTRSTPTIHQAEGVLATHLGVPIEEASKIIRSRAQRRHVSVEFVADELVAPLAGPDASTD